MPESDERSGIGASSVKLAAAVVLAVIFVAVLVVQFGGAPATDPTGRQEEPKRTELKTGRQTLQSKNVSASEGRRSGRRALVRWPVVPAAEMLAHDPFALPAAFLAQEGSTANKPHGQPAAGADAQLAEMMQRQDEQKRVLAGLEEEGVKAVIGGGKNGLVAVLGSQTVRVGDVLEGFRVVDIQRDGVVLEPMNTQQPTGGPQEDRPKGGDAPTTNGQRLFIEDR